MRTAVDSVDIEKNILDIIHPTYISNEKGERVSVIISMDDFKSMMEDWEDMQDSIAAMKRNKFIPIQSKEDLD